MTTTARQATARIADTAVLAELVIFGWDFDRCEQCKSPAVSLFWRTDESGSDVHICETCVDSGSFGCFDCD